MQQISVSDIPVDVTFKDIKNIHLSVHPPDGRVTVSAPRHVELDAIRVYAATKLVWIKKERSKILGQERQSDKDFVGRESHYFLGKRYLLKVTCSGRARVVLHHSVIELQVPANYSPQQCEALLYRFYRRELRTKLSAAVAHFAGRMSLPVPEFGIKKMHTKWGSCAIDRQFLWFNIELAKKPEQCIEYIVVHELAHLIERNHNANFTALLDTYCPGWQTQKRILNELPLYTQA